MGMHRRRVHIEFTGKKTIVITTFCRQKTFTLEKKSVIAINLFDLSTIENAWDHPFTVEFYLQSDGSYVGQVIAETKKNDKDIIGLVDWKENNRKTFATSIWMDD